MQLAASGWRRDHGENIIAEKDLTIAETGAVDAYSRSETYIASVPDLGRGYIGDSQEASVAIRFNAKIVLNGDYLVRLTLTKHDIGRLFVLQYAGCTIEELCDLFHTEGVPQFKVLFFKKVDKLNLSLRPKTCLNNDNIIYVGDLVQRTEAELLRTPNFGRTSLNEVKQVLTEMGLHLGMDLRDWPPKNVEELSNRFDSANSKNT